MRRSRGLLLLLLTTAGCAAGSNYLAPATAELGVPEHYTIGASDPLSAADLAGWWAKFGDPQLNALVERAIVANLDIRQAEARLRQAREASVQAGAAFLPNISAGGGAGRSFSSVAADSNRFSTSLDASWQMDLFGNLRRGAEAARADEAASGYSMAAVQTTVIAAVVSNYLQLRLAQEQLRIARLSLANQRDNRDIAGWRVQAGLASSLDEEQARAQLAQTEATIPTIEAQVKSALHQIALLIGEAPGVATADLETARPLPDPPPELAVGIPADTLRRRPDVRAAERNLAAATARVGVAQAALLPSLSLSGTVGSSAATTGALFDVITGSLFANLGQLIFDGGARASQLRARRAAVDGAFASYRQTVLQAVADVENALVATATANGRETQLQVAAEAAGNSAILARTQYQSGVIDFRTLLQTEQSLLTANNALAAGAANRSLAMVQLYNALGGGWQNMDGTEG